VQGLTWLGDLRNLTESLKCEKCERCFYNLSALRIHVTGVHGKKKCYLKCDYCKKLLINRGNLEKHMRLVHGHIT
jgi:Zinc finger, C2H2 type